MISAGYERNVFINCPFDDEYSPLFQAAVFAVMECGFEPRCAKDMSDSGQVRIQKLYSIIASCKLGIHDLSRVQISELSGLPRFNMPLELGIFLGAKNFGDDDQKRKMCIIFDEKPWRYQQYLSDVAGQDINIHRGNPRDLVTEIRNWLASVSPAVLPSGSLVWERYQRFQNELHALCRPAKQKPEELTYHDYIKHVDKFRTLKVDVLHTANEEIENPSSSDIKHVIRSLKGGDNSFVIYGKSGIGLTYIQAHGSKEERFVVEYQEGSLDKHYRHMGYATESDTIAAFISYAENGSDWQEILDWKKVELDV